MTVINDPGTRLEPEGEPPPSPPPRRSWDSTVAIVAVALAGVAAIWGVVAMGLAVRANHTAEAAVGAAPPASAPVEVHLSEFAIAPAQISISTGGSLSVTNMGTTAHNIVIQGTGLQTPDIPPGGTESLDLSKLAPGNYDAICTIPGHAPAGMTATLTVGGATAASGDAAGDAAGNAATGAGAMAMDPEQMDATMAARTKAFPATTKGLGAQPLAPTVLPDGTKQFDLTASVVDWEVEAGRTVKAWTYNGTVPGPTMHVESGDRVKIVLKNDLPESTALHLHGIKVPNEMDGVPDITQAPIKPGESFTYEFTAEGPAVGMYHSHHDAAKQVSDGLAGALIIGREPVPAGVTVSQEQVMMLNDSGAIGFALNGKSFPATTPIVANLGDYVMLHYLNEGAMAHPMHLHGPRQKVVAKDGIPLAQPYDVDTLVVAPGERYTVLVHADQPGTWAWHCHILTHAERDDGMFGMVTAMVVKPV